MPGCGMHSKRKLAEKARYNSLLKTKQTKINFTRLLAETKGKYVSYKKPSDSI